MPENQHQHYDILVAGAGFAGSLTALILHSQGFKVCLLEKGQHPRFAIGESSTPIADMLLRELALKYNLPWLFDFSRYGSWQQAHPEIVCGIKRGFSYFKHYPGKEFATDADHNNELLVAASVDDVQSDTNWLRADFDAFLVSKVKEAGITYFDLTDIVAAKRDIQWEFNIRKPDESTVIHASFFVDATGSGALLDKLMGVKSTSEGFLTDSFGVFSHFNDVKRWTETLHESGIPTDDFPYDPDNSALHHVLDEGWMWVLRFNDRRTSMGFAINNTQQFEDLQTEEIWNKLLEKYPSLNKIIKDLELASQPGKILRSGRLQRRTTNCFGQGWVALPHTAGFIDPLFSPGIAHTLTGIKKVTAILGENWNDTDSLYKGLTAYEHAVYEELKLIDQLVAGCYKTMKHFELFNIWSMLYFASTIAYEQRLLKKQPPGYFLGADDADIKVNIQKSYADLLTLLSNEQISADDIKWFRRTIKARIKPLNTAGLLNPDFKNMYRHTTAEL